MNDKQDYREGWHSGYAQGYQAGTEQERDRQQQVRQVPVLRAAILCFALGVLAAWAWWWVAG